MLPLSDGVGARRFPVVYVALGGRTDGRSPKVTVTFGPRRPRFRVRRLNGSHDRRGRHAGCGGSYRTRVMRGVLDDSSV
jgi:hypothetical protein